MIERLRLLSSPARYSLYVASVILLFIVALGVGATAAAIVGWQLGQTATSQAGTEPAGTDSPGTSTSDGSKSEPTSTADALEEAGIKPSDDSNNREESVFSHRATGENSRGDFTSITNPETDGDPDAIVLVSPDTKQEGNGAAFYAHNIGVWYTPTTHKWAIFNQDLAAVPVGSTFEVVVPASSAGFVHQAEPSNTAGSYTYLDSRLTNGQPDAELQVTQNWNPGGGSGVYNDHPVGVIYDSKVDQWAIYNLDGARLPRGASFNVAVSGSDHQPSG